MKTDSNGRVSMSKREVAAAFRNAAKLLDKHGWVKGEMGSNNKGFCAMGALDNLLGIGNIWAVKNFSANVTPGSLLSKLSDSRRATMVSYAIIRFNDRETTTKKDVQRFFRALARDLEHGGVL